MRAALASSPSLAAPALHAKVSKGGVEVSGVEVLDLSLAGCMLEWKGWRLQEEQRVRSSTHTNPISAVLWMP